jgi:hypothetical protein
MLCSVCAPCPYCDLNCSQGRYKRNQSRSTSFNTRCSYIKLEWVSQTSLLYIPVSNFICQTIYSNLFQMKSDQKFQFYCSFLSPVFNITNLALLWKLYIVYFHYIVTVIKNFLLLICCVAVILYSLPVVCNILHQVFSK